MEFISRSLAAIMLLALATFAYALGTLFLAAAYIVLTPANLTMVSDLSHSSDWIRFLAGLAALAAIGAAGWPVRKAASDVRDAVTALTGTLLFVLGLLIAATAGETVAAAGITGGLGIALWSVLAFRHAEGPLAGLGVLVFAVGYAMFDSVTGSTSGVVTAGLLEAAGAAAVLGSTAVVVHPRGYLRSAPGRPLWVRALIAGLLLLVVAFIASAIVSGVIYSGNATLTSVRVGPAVAYALEFLGLVMLGTSAAAWFVHLGRR
jgi:hypothetical protein